MLNRRRHGGTVWPGLRRGPVLRGLSLVELMVGLVVSLIVVGGAISMMVRMQTTTWRLLYETRLNQDLRAAADLVARDLRRGGFWGNAIQGTLAVGAGSSVAQNPYAALSNSSSDGVSYRFSRDATENNTLDDAERFGFRRQVGVLQMQTANGVWQDLTDDKNLRLTALTITPTLTTLALGSLCSKPCTAGTPNCPVSTVRSLAVTLTGQSVRDSAMVRSINLTVRLRNDESAGQCPA
jgi:type IV pilus assembly protein PilW